MAASAYTDTVQKVYIAYYGRAADPVGLAYWSKAIDDAGGSLDAIMTSFGTSAEATTLYGSLSNSAKVNAIYQQSFGRDADFTGLMYYSGQLSAGTMTASSIAQNIFDGATGTDATTLTNKLAVAKAYTTAIDTASEVVAYAGTVAAASARTLLSTVDSTTTTSGFDVATSIAGIVSAANATAVVAGSSYNLTTGVDAFTGGAGADSFVADNTATADTTSTADTLIGGLGADTLNVYGDGATFSLPALTGIETVNIYDQDDTVDISAAAWNSVTAVNLVRGVGGLTLTVGSNVETLGFEDLVDGANILVTHSATDTATNAVLNGLTGGSDLTLNGTVLTTHTISTTGVASSIGALDVDAATAITINAAAKLTATSLDTTGTATLTMSGAGAVSLGTLDADIDTITSTATGGLTAAVGAATDTVITLGSGDDVITASTEDALTATHKLAVDAGDGTDTLVLAVATDIGDATAGAHYTNFETLQTADTFDFDFIAGLTALTVTGGTAKAYTNMTATQAANVTFTADNATSTALTLKDATGTSDVVSIINKSGTATTDIDLIGLDVTGVETVNINNSTGTNTSGDASFGFLANKADAVTAVNFTGGSDVTMTVAANTLDVVAVDIDASGITGTGDFTLVQTSNLLSGSSVTGTANADTLAIGTTEGTTYTGGAGSDIFTAALASLVSTGENDNVVAGGAGTADDLQLSDATVTLTDNHFTGLTGLEKLTLDSTTGAVTITTGTDFNTAYADGITMVTGTLADSVAAVVNIQAGLSTVDMTITVDATDVDGAVGGEDMTVVTGTGADTVTITGDATYVGAVGDAGSTVINTGAGVDTISVTLGTILAQTTSQSVTIDAGTGADVITVVGVYANTKESTALFTIEAGDSLATARDTITGVDVATADLFGTSFDFSGTAAIGTLATSDNFGTILSHSITDGVATFDDASSFGSALVITADNLADVVGYIDENGNLNGVTLFTYDSTGNGTADATMMYHNGSTDSLVEMVGITGHDSVVLTAASVAGDLFVA